jgi:hypothetical protein
MDGHVREAAEESAFFAIGAPVKIDRGEQSPSIFIPG